MNFSPNISHDVNTNTFHLTFCSTLAKEDHQNYPSYLQPVIDKVQTAESFHPVECKSVINIKPHNWAIFKEVIKIRKEKGKFWTETAFTVVKVAIVVGLCSLAFAAISYKFHQDIVKSHANIGKYVNITYLCSLNGVTYKKQYPVLHTLKKYLEERNEAIFCGTILSVIPLYLMGCLTSTFLRNDPLIAKYNKLVAKNLQSPDSYTHTILFKKK